MSNSSLVEYTKYSPNNSGLRSMEVDRITPHCVVGQCSIESLGALFAQSSYQASSNYGIGSDGRVGLFVDEANRSWCSSDSKNDNRAITIECASDNTHPYAFNDAVYNRLVDLCVDICKRYGKTKLLWLVDKDTTLNYSPTQNEMVLTVHRWFANKACPGEWLMNRMGELAAMVTERLQGESSVDHTQQDGGAWSKDAREWAVVSGLIGGFDDGLFHWTYPVTREQMVAILWRFKNELEKSKGV